MRTAREIYEHYRIPPWLQEHQLRVAAVGKLLSEQLPNADERTVMQTTLLHDMGNIIKFDLSPASPLLSLFVEKGGAYWQEVQSEFKKKYGTDEHAATVTIAQEIGVSEDAMHCIEHMGLSEARSTLRQGSLELKISEYGDMRVGPYGIIPTKDRLDDLKARYQPRWGKGEFPELQQRFEDNYQAVLEIEAQLFEGVSISPGDINDASAAPIIAELWDYEVA